MVLGLSSGGVVALALAARHPDVVDRVIAWEPPAVRVLDAGEAISQQMMAPADAHLASHPGDFAGAQAALLTAILGFPVAVDDPAFAAARAHPEPMVRDDPTITLRRFGPDDLAGVDVTIAVGTEAIGPIAVGTEAIGLITAVERLTAATGLPPVVVDADNEVHLSDPAGLEGVVGPPGRR